MYVNFSYTIKEGFLILFRPLLKGYLLFFLSFFSCSTPQQNQESTSSTDNNVIDEIPVVKVSSAIRKTFVTQVITNGKVIAVQELNLNFQSQGIIKHIAVKNGALVKPGQLLASLHSDAEELALKEAQLQLDESIVEVSDQLITQGGKRGDTTSVSKDVYAYIKLRSGYDRALLAVQKARLELSKMFLFSPIAGTVANLTLSNHNQTSAAKPFCTLLNQDEMFIRCSILESELSEVGVGQTGQIQPVGRSGLVYKASILNINSTVNSQGLVDVTVRVLDPDHMLLSGMNARVIIEKSLPEQIVIFKQALVERGGRKVVFVYKDGLAKWHYVTTGLENDREVTIIEGLKVGDEVITSGHLNLGHDARVEKVESMEDPKV